MIIAETGSVLFVEEFKTSSSYRIMIDSNKFTNSLAYAFGTSIVMKKNTNDLTQVDCVGIVIAQNTFMNNFGCTNTYGNAIISCEPNHPASIQTKSSVFSSLFYDLISVQNYKTADSFSTYYNSYQFKVNNLLQFRGQNSRETALANSYKAFILNKTSTFTEKYPKISSYENSYTGVSYRTNLLSYVNNTCLNNYLIISNCIYIQGSMGILMQKNQFKDNGVPLEDFSARPEYKQSGFSIVTGNDIQIGLIENSQLTIMKEASPVVIRMGNYVHLLNCLFENNFAVFVGDFYFGAAITLEKMLGTNSITFEKVIFNKHAGYSRFFIQRSASYYFDYCSFPLVSVNYWINLKDETTLSGYTFSRIMGSHNISFLDCNFTSNTFHLTRFRVICYIFN